MKAIWTELKVNWITLVRKLRNFNEDEEYMTPRYEFNIKEILYRYPNILPDMIEF